MQTLVEHLGREILKHLSYLTYNIIRLTHIIYKQLITTHNNYAENVPRHCRSPLALSSLLFLHYLALP